MRNWIKKCFIGIALVLGVLSQQPAAHAYPCFYETNAPVQRGTGQDLLAGVVDAGTGAFIKHFVCQNVPGPTPLVGGIFYNTQDNSTGPFGKGTSTPYDFFVRATTLYPGASYELIAPGNLHYAFDTNNSGTYSDSHDPELLGATLSFTNQPTGVWATLTWKGGMRYQFDSYGGLIHIIDVYGGDIDIFRNSINGFPATIRSPTNTNRMVQYRQDSGNNHVTQILAQYSYLGNVRRWNIAYDVANNTGKMTSITDPMSHIYSFTWTSYVRSDNVTLPLMATGTDGRGMMCLSNHYDSSGRVITLDNAIGGNTSFTYSAAIGTNGTTNSVDPGGSSNTWTFTWNPNHYGYEITQIQDNTRNETTTFAHTASPTYLVTAVTDFRGRVKGYTWNATNGDMLTATSTTSTGGTATTTYTYDSVFHKRTSMTDPTGRVFHYAVNSTTSNIDSTTNFANEVTSYTYNSLGQMTSSTDPLGHVAHWGYDTYGLPTSITQPDNTVASVTRDDLGEMTQVTDELNNSVFYTYDLLGRMASVTTYPYPNAPANLALTNTYTRDAVGNVLTAVDPVGHTWSWTYDCANNPLTETNPLNQTRNWSWSPTCKELSYTDFAGNKIASTYLTDGRLSTTSFLNSQGGTDSTLNYNYDSGTHVISNIVDSITGTYSYTTDLVGQLTNFSGPNGSVAYQYDLLGRPTQMTPTSQPSIAYTYHARGNVATITQGGTTTNITCNALGQVTNKTLPNGVSTVVAHDACGRTTMVCSTNTGGVCDETDYTYDAAGKLSNIVATSGSSHAISYNGFNQVTQVTDQNNSANTYSWTYNNSGLRATQTVNSTTTPYTYNNANQLTAIGSNAITINSNGDPTAYNGNTYNWSTQHRLAGYTSGGNTYNYTYTPWGGQAGSVINNVSTINLTVGNSVLNQTTNGTTTSFLYGPGGVLKVGSNYILGNGTGSTTVISNGSGTTVGNYGYTPFGTPIHTGGTSTNVQFAGGLSDNPNLVSFGSKAYGTDFGGPLSVVPIHPQGPPLPGQGYNSSLVNTNFYDSIDPNEQGEYPGGAGGGGGGSTSYTGAPNYAPGCGPVGSNPGPDGLPMTGSASGPYTGTYNGWTPNTIRLGLMGQQCPANNGCDMETQLGQLYPFPNTAIGPGGAIGPGRIVDAVNQADMVIFETGGMDMNQAYGRVWNWEANGMTNTEFQMCHNLGGNQVVQWQLNGEPIPAPSLTYQGIYGPGVAKLCNIQCVIGNATFITGPVGPYSGPPPGSGH